MHQKPRQSLEPKLATSRQLASHRADLRRAWRRSRQLEFFGHDPRRAELAEVGAGGAVDPIVAGARVALHVRIERQFSLFYRNVEAGRTREPQQVDVGRKHVELLVARCVVEVGVSTTGKQVGGRGGDQVRVR